MEFVSKANSATVTILLVEDDDGDAKAVRRAFTKAKIANPIIRAEDGIDALEHLRGENGRQALRSPLLLLVDLNMPRMNGFELVSTLRSDPELRRTIVFFLTTSKNDEDVARAYDLNIAGYIVKQNAGVDFLNLVGMIDSYWKIVELPV